MSRIRYIKPGFFENEELAECGALARILYAGLWCWADREGRLEDRPRRLKAQILPYDDCDVESLMSELERGGFIQRYEVDGERYLAIPQFSHHQKPHRHEPASTLPAPPNSPPYTDIGGREPDKGGIDNGKVAQERVTGNGELVTENGERVTGKETAAPSDTGYPPDVGLVARALDLDRPTDRQAKRLMNGLHDQKYRHLNGEMVADAYAEWQESLPPGKRHRDRVGGFLNQLEMRREQPAYFREAAPSSNGGPPVVDEPATSDDILEYIRSHSPHPEQWQS